MRQGTLEVGSAAKNYYYSVISGGAAPVEKDTVNIAALITHGSRDKNEIALTFDADMTPKMKKEMNDGKVKSWYDARITAILEKENVPATFFITGMWAEMYPDAVKDISGRKLFEIGNHSYDHAAFHLPCYKLAPATNTREEVAHTQKILAGLIGREPTLFRFPGGCADDAKIKEVSDSGLTPIGWDVSSADAFSYNAAAILRQVLGKTQNGSIIVMHLSGPPNAPETAAVLPGVIQQLRAKGFTFVTLSKLLNLP